MELANVFAIAYNESKQHFAGSSDYIYNSETESLRSAKNGKDFIVSLSDADAKAFNKAAQEQDSTVYSEDTNVGESGVGRFEVKEAFIDHLAGLSSWEHIAGGRFEKEVARAYDAQKTFDN